MNQHQGMMVNPNMMTTQNTMTTQYPNIMSNQSQSGIFNLLSNEFESQLKPDIIAQGPEKVSICKKAVGFGWANYIADGFNSDTGQNITGIASTYYIWLCTGGTLMSLISFYIVSVIIAMFIVSYITSYIKGFIKPMKKETFESIPKCPNSVLSWAKSNPLGSMCFSGIDISYSKKYIIEKNCVNKTYYGKKTKCTRYENVANLFTSKDYNGYIQDFKETKKIGYYISNFIFGIVFGSIIFSLYIKYLKYTKILNSSGVGKNFLASALT